LKIRKEPFFLLSLALPFSTTTQEHKRDRNQDQRNTEESIKDAQGHGGELADRKS
jgi:hypothetical protein